MPIAIPGGLTDDNDFIEKLNSMLTGLTIQETPEELWVIQIDNWFDHKWLRYSGIGRRASSFPADYSSSFMDRFATVKGPLWQDKLTLPPFTPERILGQWSFQRSDGGYVELPLPKLPHGAKRRWSKANLHNRAEDYSSSATFVWFSGNTLKNGRGCVMVYNVKPPQPVCWYAAFAREQKWMLKRAKGIDTDHVSGLLVA